MAFEAFPVRTCEEIVAGAQPFRLAPTSDEDVRRFLIQDPFGLRRAVVPLFEMNEVGELRGLGTGVVVDGLGTIITADHVVASMRGGTPRVGEAGHHFDEWRHGVVAFYGMGLVFGTVGVPGDALGIVTSTFTPAIPVDDPLAHLSGRPSLRTATDLAVLRVGARPPEPLVNTLPIRLTDWMPQPGEIVCAIGFPEIETIHGDVESARNLIREGMYGAYGRVVDVHPRQRDSANPGAVFEVRANWPSGMSGGPVLNAAGEVIGLVSRSIEPESEESLGHGWAVWFSAMPFLETVIPEIDALNPVWRKGWTALRQEPWDRLPVFRSRGEAQAAANKTSSPAEYQVVYGSYRPGSDGFSWSS